MLVLTRREGCRFLIGDDIVVEVIEIRGNTVRIGITAPPDVPVHRQETYDRIKAEEAELKHVDNPE